MNTVHWQIEESLRKELDDHYKSAYAIKLVEADPLEAVKALTFDNLANNVTVTEIHNLLQTIESHFAPGCFKGVGLEVGSGPGTFVAALANLPKVEKVYGVDACEAIVEKLMVKVVDHIAPQNTSKVTGVVGEFNNLELPDESVDFVFDFFSLHHSPKPEVTLTEIGRVLKPGGVVIALDKARADSLSEADLEALLDIEYTDKMKQLMGVPINQKHTRRMNGEFEYRLKDWRRAFEASGFSDLQHYNVAKIGGNKISRTLKHLLARLPVQLQSKLSRYVSSSITNNLEPSNRIFFNIFPSYPREFSLMVAHKK